MTNHLNETELQIVHDGLLAAIRLVQEGREGATHKVEDAFNLALAGDRAALLRLMRSMKEEQDGRDARTSSYVARGQGDGVRDDRIGHGVG